MCSIFTHNVHFSHASTYFLTYFQRYKWKIPKFFHVYFLFMWIRCYRLKLSDLSFGKSSENNDRLSSVLYYTWIFNAQSKYQTLKRNLWVTQCNIYHRYQWISIINSYRPNFSKEKNQSCYFKNTFIVKTVSEFYFLKHWI